MKLYNKNILRDMVYAGTDFKGWENIIEQILDDQAKATRLDNVLGSPYKITYHGASKYTSVAVLNKEHLRQILEKAEKWNKYKDGLKSEETTIKKLEQDNKQLKERITKSEKQIGDLLHEKSTLKQKLEKTEKEYQLFKDGFSKLEGWCQENEGLRETLDEIFKEILESKS